MHSLCIRRGELTSGGREKSLTLSGNMGWLQSALKEHALNDVWHKDKPDN